jgi:sugar phosphate permease
MAQTISPEEIRKVVHYRRFVSVILAMMYFLGMFHRVSPGVMAKEFMDTFGIGATALGLLGGAYFYPYAVAQIPAGVLSDVWGIRKTITLFVAIAGLGTLLTGIGTSLGMVIFGRLLIGFGFGFVYISVLRAVFSWFRVGERGTTNGLLIAIGNVGALSAAGPLAVANTLIGWHNVFYLLSGITAAMCIVAYAIVRDQPGDKGLPSFREIEEHEGRVFVEDPPLAKISVRQAVTRVFTGRRFGVMAAWSFMVYGVMMTYQGLWGGPYFEDILGWAKEYYGFLLSIMGIGCVLGFPFWGWAADKLLRSRKKVLITGTVGMTTVWFVLWSAIGSSNYGLYAVLNFLFGFFGGNVAVSFVQIAELYPREIAGTASSCLNIFFFLGGAVMMHIVSAVIGSYGEVAGSYPFAAYSTGWLFMGLILVTASVCALFTPERKIL